MSEDGVTSRGGPNQGADGHEATSTPQWLTAVRTHRRYRLPALVGATLVGVGVASVHWLGLFVAGALVGLVSEDLPRAVAAGLTVGLLVLSTQVLVAPTMNVSEFANLVPASYVTIAAALLAPVWGSLVRGVL
jgi:NO-binding membrane sensor protein with MHYT domain